LICCWQLNHFQIDFGLYSTCLWMIMLFPFSAYLT
jgi:hypothetical protein